METIYSTAVYDHPGWDPVAIVDDFTLVQLESRSTIEPVPIDQGTVSTSYAGGEPLWVIGLGADSHTFFGVKTYPDHVQHAEVPYVDSDTCSEIMDGYIPGLSITPQEMCAGPTDLSAPDVGTCNGDSGGPIYDKASDTLVGVTSWGIQGLFGPFCGETPGVYARIADQWDEWIKPVICENHSDPKPDFCDIGSTDDDGVDDDDDDDDDSVDDNDDNSTSCGSGEDTFTLELMTDDIGDEITWGLAKKSGNKFSLYDGPNGAAAGEPYGDNASFTEERCIPEDECYKFVIHDSSGDGLCCTNGEGSYNLYLNDELIKTSSFANKKKEVTKFGSC